MNFLNELERRTAEAEKTVRSYLPGKTLHQHSVTEAMEYSVTAGGKRLRPVMMKAAFEMCGGSGTAIDAFMAAIEMIHSYMNIQRLQRQIHKQCSYLHAIRVEHLMTWVIQNCIVVKSTKTK